MQMKFTVAMKNTCLSLQKPNIAWQKKSARGKRKPTPRFCSRFAKMCNADAAENAYIGGLKPNNGFAANVECGQSLSQKELSDAITIKLEWIQRHSEVIHPPTTQRNVQSIEGAKLTREIQTDLLETEPNADALFAKILHRAELEYQFCSAGDADPASLQMQKACAEYKPTDDFPYTFYKGIVSDVSLYRDTHIEFKLRNGQTV